MTLIKTASLLMFALGFCLSTTACSNGNDDGPTEKPGQAQTVTVTPQSLTLNSEKQTAEISVRASAGWNITSEAAWIKVFPNGGVKDSDSKITLTVDANTDINARTGNLTIKCGATTQTVTVTQNPSARVNINNNAVTFGAQQPEGKVLLTSNTAWTATADQQWCTLSPAQGDAGEFELAIKAAANTSNSTRTATVTVAYDGGQQQIAVTQLSDAVNVPAGYTMVWNDEFNEGAKPGSKWNFETGGGGWGNNELQNYVNATAPNGENLAKVENGILSIICKKINGTVYSIRMNSNESWTYGYFEARMRLPKGKGSWPAYWMMPKNFTSWPDDGEIDIMEEVGYNPNRVSSSVHTKDYNHVMGTQKTREILVEGAQDEFHVYALEWTPDFIRTYVDGKELFYYPNDKAGKKSTWPFNAPFYLKFNLAWGGNWGGAQGIDDNALPCTYQIDYVRVFQKN